MSRDRVCVRGLRVLGRHGVLPEEHARDQPFVIDISAVTDVRAAGQSDALADTLDYAKMASLASRIVAEESCALLERVAALVCRAILADAHVEEVTVGVKKPQAPLGLDAAFVEVVVTRSRADFPEVFAVEPMEQMTATVRDGQAGEWMGETRGEKATEAPSRLKEA